MSQKTDTIKTDAVDFALALYRRFAAGDDPVLLSPLSVSLALRPLHAGARGETAAGILRALGGRESRSGDPADLEAALCLAVGLWLDRSFTVDPAFVEAVNSERGVGWFDVSFADAEATRGKINLWTEERTNRRIRDLIPPPGLDPQTQLVATSAVHFRDQWYSPFPAEATSPAPFTRADGTHIQIPMMRDVKSARFARNGDSSLLELHYRHGCSLYVVLPDFPSGLARLEARITPAMLGRWIDSLAPREVDVWLPRFRTESGHELSRELSELGMMDAFDAERADFSAIGRSVSGRRLFLSVAFHKTFIDVNELETEAAAATAFGMAMSARHQRKPRHEEFHADRPFLYLIRNGPRGSIVFIGRMTGR